MKRRTLVVVTFLCGIALSCKMDPSQARRLSAPNPLPSAFCVTHGTVSPAPVRIETMDPEMRGYFQGSNGDFESIDFNVTGMTPTLVPLSNGSVRFEICLKLRAADSCNVVYACIRTDKTTLEVQVKSNPGETTDDQCGTAGYHKATPAWSSSVPSIWTGSHSFAASITEDAGAVSLDAFVDGTPSWSGPIDNSALTIDGPAGLRSDNLWWHGFAFVDANCQGI